MTTEGCFLIWGASHSGSTLLGFLLGSQEHCFALGEWINYCADELLPHWGDGTWPMLADRRRIGGYKSACSRCGRDCPIWRRGRAAPRLPIRHHYKHVRSYLRSRGLRVGWLVDSSKHPWYYRRMIRTSWPEWFVHLLVYKEPWAWLAGRERRARRPLVEDELPTQDGHRCEHMRNTLDVLKPYEYHVVRYRDVAERTGDVIRAALSCGEMSGSPVATEYWLKEHHQIAGNPGAHSNITPCCDLDALPYAPDGPRGIVLDPAVAQPDERLVQTCIHSGVGRDILEEMEQLCVESSLL